MTSSVRTGNPPDNAPPGDEFYRPQELADGGQRGEAIYQRPLAADHPAALADGENWLVLYRSQDAAGEAVATSGIVVLPKTDPPEGGYPVVSWAHGTVGVADTCAPSRDTPASCAHPMNVYPHTLLGEFLRRNWAVVMTDYEGLGVEGRVHPYLLGASEAAGVLDIVRTAHNLFGARLSNRFAIVGHSQGGQAALFAASHAPAWISERNPELTLVAVAAIAPANHVLGLVKVGALSDETSDGFAFTPLLLCGAMAGGAAAGEEIRHTEVLSDTALERWEHVFDRCRAGLSQEGSWGGLKGNEQFRPTAPFLRYPTVCNEDQKRFNRQVEAMNPDVTLTVPTRISQAEDDDRVRADPDPHPDPEGGLLKGTDALVEELKRKYQCPEHPLVYERYPTGYVTPDPELNVHFATINYDLPKLINWLDPFLEPPS